MKSEVDDQIPSVFARMRALNLVALFASAVVAEFVMNAGKQAEISLSPSTQIHQAMPFYLANPLSSSNLIERLNSQQLHTLVHGDHGSVGQQQSALHLRGAQHLYSQI